MHFVTELKSEHGVRRQRAKHAGICYKPNQSLSNICIWIILYGKEIATVRRDFSLKCCMTNGGVPSVCVVSLALLLPVNRC